MSIGFITNDPLNNLTNLYQRPQFIPGNRIPTTNDQQPPGTQWQNGIGGTIYETTGNGVWYTSSSSVSSVLGTANQITATTSGQVTTLSIPTTFIAPGSIASTTTITAATGLTVTAGGATVTAGGLTVTAGGAAITGTTTINNSGSAVTTIGTGGTGAVNIGNATGNTAVTGSLTASTTLTATSGNITASAGNLVSAGTGNGLSLPVVVVGAGASPQTANGRAVQVTFSGVSIAAGATQTLTITNSAISASTTNLHVSFWGATTGAALTIQSVTAGTGTVAIVMQNGTGATTTSANLTFSVLVLD